MIPDRFQQIADLYHSVRECTAEERRAILDRAEPDLRSEVESLLAQPAEGGFLEHPPTLHALAWVADTGDPTLVEGTELGPYRIAQKLGEGGMGDVYRAIDTRLGRAVALKLTRDRFSANFQREARAISSLNHSNVCALYDVGPDFMVMELVEGTTLAARIAQGPLHLHTALAYAAQILDALAAAHAKGVVHRDLKPGNIMLAESGVKVLDFGLAKFVTDDTLTGAGNVMGTPAYISPEQRQGSPADPRSDIYSFGCVLYEMLTGSRVGACRERIVPRKLERIVERCLEDDPARRFQTVADLQRALSALGAGGAAMMRLGHARAITAACAVMAAVAAAAWLQFGSPPALTDKDTVVLADFTNRTGDPVFDGALRQGLSVQLEQSPFLSIVPDGLVRQTLALMGRKSDSALTPAVALDLCQRVGSAAVIEGSIAQIGTPYQVAVRAVDCANGETLASVESQAADKNHVLAALGNASSRLRARIGESMHTVKKYDTPLEQATTASLPALKAYSDAMKLISSGTDVPSSILFLQRAIELDPQFAQAYGMLSIAYTTQGESRLAADYAREAYAWRDKVSEPERYFILSRYGKAGNGDIEMAIRACLAWIQAYPRMAMPRTELGGSIYPVAGEYEKAAAQLAKSIRLMPSQTVSYSFLMDAYIALNRFDDAKNVHEWARKQNLHSGFYVFNLYELAFLLHDPAGMARQLTAVKGEQGMEGQLLAWEAETAGYYGRLGISRDISDRAIEAARHAAGNESAAAYLAMSALREALYGNTQEAERRAASAHQQSPARDVQFGAALAFSYAGNEARLRELIDRLANDYPEDTLAQQNYLPVLRARLALGHGEAAEALAILKSATTYEYGMTRYSAFGWTSMYPIYVRGEAYLAMHEPRKAAAEFQKILDHPGLALNYPIGPMARLQKARALAAAGLHTDAVTAYRDLLDLWKGADPDLPVLKQAAAESAHLD